MKSELITTPTPRNFVIIYESVYKNTTLSIEAFAIIHRLLENSPNYKPTTVGLALSLNTSKYKILKGIKELQEKGYLKIENHYKNGSIWTVSQYPTLNIEKFDVNKIDVSCFNFSMLDSLVKSKAITPKQAREIVSRQYEIAKTNWID